jgi:hypothetical protein
MMSQAVGAGARLDRLPISAFHYRIFWLIAAGMFFDGYDLYVGGNVSVPRCKVTSPRLDRTRSSYPSPSSA